MSAPVELKKHVKQLQQATAARNEADILSLLAILKTEYEVTEQILRESKCGLAVGKLRTHESPKVASAAKDLVKLWKTKVDKAKNASKTPTGSGKSAAAAPAAAAPPPTPTVVRNAKTDAFTVSTGTTVRDKCAELIYDALAGGSNAPSELISKRAKEVEAAVWKNLGDNLGDYRQKIRSLFVNLKDKKNPTLREDVVSGETPAAKFVVMTSEEMASDEQKAALKKINEENLFKSLAAQEAEAETDAFQCGKCKQRKCRYRQAQTRSADEPMTTFVTCVACGNRWKFS